MEDNTASGSLGSIRDRFPIKRSNNPRTDAEHFRDHHNRFSRSRFSRQRFNRKGLFWLFPFRCKSVFYALVLFAVFVFAMASVVLQHSITSVFSRQGSDTSRFLKEGLKLVSTLKFVPPTRFVGGEGLDRLRFERRIGVRLPRLALILGSTRNDPSSLLLYSVVKNLKKLGYKFKIYSVEDAEMHSMWEEIGSHIEVLDLEQHCHIDWSMYEGVIAGSVEAKHAISSLMQEPFCSIPLIWIIQEDVLAKRLPHYFKRKENHLLSVWRRTFSRANAILFSDYSLPMLYSILDDGNFFVIPGSPLDVWSAEQFQETHDKRQLRLLGGYNEDDIVVLVIGNPFFYNELSWDYAVAMHAISPLLVKYAKGNEPGQSVKFVFLCSDSTDGSDAALQDVTSRLGLAPGSVKHFGMNADVNGVLSMADAVLYGSFQDGQGFPPLLIRAMTFGLPIVVPDTPSISKYVLDGVNSIFFSKNVSDALVTAFSLLLSDGRLSELAHSIAASGKRLAKNMLASECITTYAKLLENVLSFPSDAVLPVSVSQLQQFTWEWNFIRKETNKEQSDIFFIDDKDTPIERSSLVYDIEEQLADHIDNPSVDERILSDDIPTEQDLKILLEIEQSEESENVEIEELEERMEKGSDDWNEIYRNARKAEKLNFEANERDEGELERTGQPVCIYEIYEGSGAWPFLHHGSLYRGLSLSKKARRSRSDDVDAVLRLPLLNDTNHRNSLCEMGGMFSIANKVDNIHKRPWIGFQSWRAAGRKVSLSPQAEKVLEETIKAETKGEVIYFWTRLDMDGGITRVEDVLTFWSMCDILNGGVCRNAFELSFRKMYNLPPHLEALPPMPDDGGYWSAMHSWVMPTPSFLEFVMFARMFTDSLDSLHINHSSQINFCLLGTTEFEKRHCYCRVLELLVNVWSYHSGRKLVYMDPNTGSLSDQHPVELRRGYMWTKYFNFTLLKSMDEDLAEAADDGDYPYEEWLWPLTGEVHWQGIYEKERERRYRVKMEKKRKARERYMERQKNGYKQKPVG